MKIVNFLEGKPGQCWDSSVDSNSWGHDLCLRTEGEIEFGTSPDNLVISVFLLEFFLETKTAVFKTLGNSNFEIKVALPLSGDGYFFSRSNDKVTFKFRYGSARKMRWTQFLQDLEWMESELAAKIQTTFPRKSATMEFKTLFGSN